MPTAINMKLWRARFLDWLSSSISNRITFAALSLAMAVALVVGISSYGVLAVLVQHSIKAELDAQAKFTLLKLQGDLQAISSDLVTVSANSFIANGLVDSLGRDTYLLPFMREHKPSVPFSTAVVLCDFRGRPVASNNPAEPMPEVALSGVHEVLLSAKAKTEVRKLPQGTFLVMVQPVIFPPTGQAEGALVETVNLQELFRSETGHLGGDYSMRLLARGSEAARSGRTTGEEDLVTVQHRLVLDQPLKDLDLAFQIGLSRRTAEKPLQLLTLVYLLVGAVLPVLVLKFAKETAHRLTMPLISLSMTARTIAASGSLDLTAEVSGRDEVGALATVFNDMLKKLRSSHELLESKVERRTRELKEAHDLLELRVQQRTAELMEINLRLEQEIDTTAQLEQQLRQVQKMEAVGTLAGGIAHDFNNILTVIGAYSSLTWMQMSETDPLRENLDQITAATEKAANLTQSLLAFGRKQVMNPRDSNLNEIIENVEKFLQRVIGEDIQLVTSLKKAELWAHLDPGQIEQVLMNLAANARDAMPTGGALTISTELERLDEAFQKAHGGTLSPGRYALITVSDSGCGMDQETLRKIFEPFFTTKDVGKGTGLGLAMVYGIIKQHNGHITVYSEPGVGTTFRIYLPALDSRPAPQRLAGWTAAASRTGNETILIAEDDADVRCVMEKILAEAGYTVIFAVDGTDAVEKFTAHSEQIRLVILDMIMPRKSGKEACHDIRQLEPGARVLFASGYTADFIRNRGELQEGAELIMKPVHPSELLRKVREMLDR